jgi:hypothetical protein
MHRSIVYRVYRVYRVCIACVKMSANTAFCICSAASKEAVPSHLDPKDIPKWVVSANVWVGVNAVPLPDTDMEGQAQKRGARAGSKSKALPAGTPPGSLFQWAAAGVGTTVGGKTTGGGSTTGGTAACGRAGVASSADCFKPKPGSVIDHTGSPDPDAGLDYYGVARDAHAPSVGFAE